MNILIVLPNDKLGGAEQYLKLLAEYFLKKKYNVIVVFFQEQQQNGWENLNAFKNFNFVYNTNNKLAAFASLIKYFNTNKVEYDYVFTSHVKATSFVGLVIKLKLLKTKFFIARESTSIFTRYKGIKLFIYKCYYRIGYSSVNLLICQTEYMKSQLLSALPFLKHKTVVINNPIDLNLIKNKEQKPLINKHKNYIITAGRLIPEKGFDILIEAFNRINLKYPEKDLRLVLLGEGKQDNSLKAIVDSYNLNKKVIFEGFVDNVYPYFKNAELCVVSSRVEGFPNVLLQMMSQNSKVVSTLCAGGIDSIEGIVKCKPNDIDSLEKAIIIALNNNIDNNLLFNTYLKDRTVDNFIKKIYSNLNNTIFF